MIGKVLILGGTGAMGVHLCNILKEQGYSLYVTSRSQILSKDGINYIQGNAHDLNFLKPLLTLNAWDAIVDFMAYSTEEFKQRYKSLLSSTKQYIYLSSARVYADSVLPITEESPRLLDVCDNLEYLSTDEYALAKARQEDILNNSGLKNYSIIRPYITYSEQRLQLSAAEKESWLYRALNGGTILFSEDLANKYTTFTYGYDVALGIAAIIGKVDAMGESFHITSNENYRWIEILERYLSIIEKKTGHRPKLLMLKKWMPLVGGSIQQVKYDRIYNRCFDNSKINKFLDVSTFKETMPAIEECLSAFIDNPNFKSINWYEEMMKDKYIKEWTTFLALPYFKLRLKYLLIKIGIYKYLYYVTKIFR